jgi:hypothetical protein
VMSRDGHDHIGRVERDRQEGDQEMGRAAKHSGPGTRVVPVSIVAGSANGVNCNVREGFSERRLRRFACDKPHRWPR